MVWEQEARQGRGRHLQQLHHLQHRAGHGQHHPLPLQADRGDPAGGRHHGTAGAQPGGSEGRPQDDGGDGDEEAGLDQLESPRPPQEIHPPHTSPL